MRDENDMNGFDGLRLGLIAAIVLAALLFVVRFLGAFRFAILAFLVVMVVGYGLWWAYQYWQSRHAERAHRKTRLGQIQERLYHARQALESHQLAIDRLRESQEELRKSGKDAADSSDQVKARTAQLLTDYAEEIALRQRKLAFYTQSVEQLKKLEAHHRWLTTLKEKEAELARYRQQHARDDEAMESLRWTLENESEWLSRWSVLSERLEASDSPETVEEMRESLKELLV